jgi:hypothetical protein
MGNAKRQPECRKSEYKSLALSYLYLQSVRRKAAMYMLPPDLLDALGCSVERTGMGASIIRVDGVLEKEPEKAVRIAKALRRICSSRANRDVFGHTNPLARSTLRGFFMEMGLLVRAGPGMKPKAKWFKDPELAAEAVNYLYLRILKKDPSKSPPERTDFTRHGLKELLDTCFGGDPENAVKCAGLVPPGFIFKKNPTPGRAPASSEGQ